MPRRLASSNTREQKLTAVPTPTKGRPCPITPELTEKMCASIHRGNYIVTAAGALGIPEGTVKDWINKGNKDITNGKPDTPYAVFTEAVSIARRRNEDHLVNIIQEVADGGHLIERTVSTKGEGHEVVRERFAPPDSKAAAWLLERQRPGSYGRQERKSVLSDGKGEAMTIADIARLAQTGVPLKAPGADSAAVN